MPELLDREGEITGRDRVLAANEAPLGDDPLALIGDGSQFSHFTSRLGAPRNPESEISEHHKNIAFAVQDACEEAMMSVVKMALQKTKNSMEQ